jgi:hypothetical protein
MIRLAFRTRILLREFGVTPRGHMVARTGLNFLPAISHHRRRARKPDGTLGGTRKRQCPWRLGMRRFMAVRQTMSRWDVENPRAAPSLE